MRRGSRGLSLVELVVAMFLASFVSLVVYTMFSTSLNLSQLLQGEEEATRRLLVLQRHLEREVNETDLAGATLVGTTSPGFRPAGSQELCAVAFPSARDPQTGDFVTDPATAEPRWQSLRVFYLPAGRSTLKAATVPLASLPSARLPLAEADVERLCGTGPGDVLADDVASMNLAIEPVQVVNPPVSTGSAFQPTAVKPGLLHAWIALRYADRRGRAGNSSMDLRLLARNSFFTGWPPVYPSPSATPTPPPDIPEVPKDWPTEEEP